MPNDLIRPPDADPSPSANSMRLPAERLRAISDATRLLAMRLGATVSAWDAERHQAWMAEMRTFFADRIAGVDEIYAAGTDLVGTVKRWPPIAEVAEALEAVRDRARRRAQTPTGVDGALLALSREQLWEKDRACAEAGDAAQRASVHRALKPKVMDEDASPPGSRRPDDRRKIAWVSQGMDLLGAAVDGAFAWPKPQRNAADKAEAERREQARAAAWRRLREHQALGWETWSETEGDRQ